jgi:hypothetical protein
MRATKSQLVPVLDHGTGQMTLRGRLRGAVADHAGEILAEIAPTLRRFRTMLLVVTISVPVFFAGLLIVMWHLAR